jgi:phage terminase small subunit
MKKKSQKRGLSYKQALFVEEYLVDLNATQAAIRAKYSKNSATEIGYENLRKPHIKEAIQEGFKRLRDTVRVNQDDVIGKFVQIAQANLDDYLEWDDVSIILNPSAELTREQKYCLQEIQKIEGEKTSNVKIKLHDKVKALENLGRHLGIFLRDNEQKKPEVIISAGCWEDPNGKTEGKASS